MEGDWSQSVQRQYVGGNARFDFPIRSLGWGKIIGLVLIGFGLIFVWQPAHNIWGTIHELTQGRDGAGNWFTLIIGIPFLIGGCIPALIGLSILSGRNRVEWKDGRLSATEILGPLWWTRRMPRKAIRKLDVSAATAAQNTGGPRQEYPQLSSLAVEFEDGSKKLLLLGYPKAWLLSVAQELKNYADGGAISSAVPVEIIETTALNPNDAEVLPQPPGSLVRVEEGLTGVRLLVPPAGLRKGSKGLFSFALLWCGFMTVFTTIVVISFIGGSFEQGWGFIVFIIAFWGVGGGLLVGAVNMGKRTATLSVQGGELRIEVRGLFGTKQWAWRREEVAAIRVDDSGMRVNDRPVLNLQVHPCVGKKTGVLAGRDEDELRWMATRLRSVLKVPAR